MDWTALDWAAAAQALAIVGAVLIAWWQVREARKHTGVQRVLDYHLSLTTGELGAARDRLSSLMWQVGERVQPGRCYRPTFGELLGDQWIRAAGGGEEPSPVYPDGIAAAGVSPMQDLYKVLWMFERIEAARREGLLHEDLLRQMLGAHAVWWDTLTSRITPEDTRHRAWLSSLAEDCRQRDPQLLSWAQADFVQP